MLAGLKDRVGPSGHGGVLAEDSAGGNYVQSFTIQPNTSRIVSLPDFARGPGQRITLNGTTGIPVVISDGDGVRSVEFTLDYDPALLNIIAVALAPGVPDGWQLISNLTTAGRAVVSLWGTTSLPAGARTLVTISADVPTSAGYRQSNLLMLSGLLLNEGQIAATADSAMHKVAYLGDATGNGTYSGLDASYIARVVVSLNSGFDAYAMTDPAIVADATGNGTISALDASYVAAKAAGLSQPEIPNLPSGVTITVSGPDPAITLPTDVLLRPGGSKQISALIDDAAGVQALDLSLDYNTAMLDLFSGDVMAGSLLASDWSLVVNATDASGRVTIVAYAAEPITVSAGGEILKVNLHATANATSGQSPLDLGGYVNEGGMTLTANDGLTRFDGISPTTSAQINDGQVQRSLVDRITLSFNEPVILVQGDIQLLRNSGSPVADTTVSIANPSGDQKTFVLTFSGSAVTNGSLADGIYRLSIAPTAATDLAGNPLAGPFSMRFHRLFGDADGDRDVDNADLLLFRKALNRPENYSLYTYFDANGDGKVDRSDYTQFKQYLTRRVLR